MKVFKITSPLLNLTSTVVLMIFCPKDVPTPATLILYDNFHQINVFFLFKITLYHSQDLLPDHLPSKMTHDFKIKRKSQYYVDFFRRRLQDLIELTILTIRSQKSTLQINNCGISQWHFFPSYNSKVPVKLVFAQVGDFIELFFFSRTQFLLSIFSRPPLLRTLFAILFHWLRYNVRFHEFTINVFFTIVFSSRVNPYRPHWCS